MRTQPTENQKTVFSRVVQKVRKGTKVSISKEMRDSGVYSESMSKKPDKLTKSKGWNILLETHLGDDLLAETHHGLLKSTTLDHMTFPPFNAVKAKKEVVTPVTLPSDTGDIENVGEKFGEQLNDQEIRDLLASVNCQVRKIVHGELARHVYYWCADNRARKDGLDLAYKLKGKYAPEKRLDVVINIDAKKKAKIDRILGIT